MTQRLPITIRLEAFEGPLDLLLHLIQTHEFDISTVSISKITDQYLRTVLLMHELNFDVASEFLVMAATLLVWKSRALLPKEGADAENTTDGEEVFSQEELIRRLLEHRRFQQAAKDFTQLPRLFEDVFTRENPKPPIDRIWKSIDLTQLALAYQRSLIHSRKRTQLLKKETVSIGEKIRDMAAKLQLGRPTSIDDLLPEGATWPDKVVTFLASLELGKLRKMRLHQTETEHFTPIFL
ncbi:MAG: segregation/condensation protein A, partial [Bdellovibrionota bacterium]